MKNPELCWNVYATSLTYVQDLRPQIRGQTMFNEFILKQISIWDGNRCKATMTPSGNMGSKDFAKSKAKNVMEPCLRRVWLNKGLATNTTPVQSQPPWKLLCRDGMRWVESKLRSSTCFAPNFRPTWFHRRIRRLLNWPTNRSRFCALQKAAGMKERRFKAIKKMPSMCKPWRDFASAPAIRIGFLDGLYCHVSSMAMTIANLMHDLTQSLHHENESDTNEIPTTL